MSEFNYFGHNQLFPFLTRIVEVCVNFVAPLFHFHYVSVVNDCLNVISQGLETNITKLFALFHVCSALVLVLSVQERFRNLFN